MAFAEVLSGGRLVTRPCFVTHCCGLHVPLTAAPACPVWVDCVYSGIRVVLLSMDSKLQTGEDMSVLGFAAVAAAALAVVAALCQCCCVGGMSLAVCRPAGGTLQAFMCVMATHPT